MKKLSFLLIIIVLIHRLSLGSNEKLSIVDKEFVAETQEIDSIIGEWHRSSTISVEIKHKNSTTLETRTETICNGCGTISFKKGGIGILKNAIGEESSFYWEIDKDKMRFSFNCKYDENLFFSNDKEFEFKIYNESTHYFLELIVPKKNYRYVLIR